MQFSKMFGSFVGYRNYLLNVRLERVDPKGQRLGAREGRLLNTVLVLHTVNSYAHYAFVWP